MTVDRVDARPKTASRRPAKASDDKLARKKSRKAASAAVSSPPTQSGTAAKMSVDGASSSQLTWTSCPTPADSTDLSPGDVVLLRAEDGYCVRTGSRLSGS
eukprot:SAG31_NODE_18930_length_617_cov_1.494208_1_plen_100_part_10